jgi:lysophospholipase L1-like esterase
MNFTLRVGTVVLFAAGLLLPQDQKTNSDLQWLTLPHPPIEINGLPWLDENKYELIRLPLRVKDMVPKEVWSLAQDPAGARIRFRTDSSTVAIRLEYPRPPDGRNLHAFGQTGVDLYVDGAYRSTAVADKESKPGRITEFTYFKAPDKPRLAREIVLYLPTYFPVQIHGIGLDKAAKVWKPASFALPKPIVFYGTSITQGGCASRPGMAYQAILGRKLNVDFVNLGFSGAGKGEPIMAQTVAEIDAACFVLDFAQNNPTVESLAEVYGPFIETLRSKHPGTPVLANTPIYSSGELLNPNHKLAGMRYLIREVVSKRIAAGDKNIQIIEGTDMLGPNGGDGLVDGTHPNDLGFQWMADAFSARLSKMLGLPATK